MDYSARPMSPSVSRIVRSLSELNDYLTSAAMPSMQGTSAVVLLRGGGVSFSEERTTASIRTVFGGAAVCTLDGTQHVIEAGSFLVVNAGTRCTTTAVASTPVEYLAVHFSPRLVAEALSNLSVIGRGAIAGEGGDGESGPMIDTLFRSDTLVAPILEELYDLISRGVEEGTIIDLKVRALLEALIVSQERYRAEMCRLPVMRSATRVDLYKRLNRARMYIDDNLHMQIPLPEMAGIACLSTHYFLRRFEQVFLETPHQYLIRRRVERARHLLASTPHSIADVGIATGYRNPAAFSSLFRKHTGKSPLEFRGVRPVPPPSADAS